MRFHGRKHTHYPLTDIQGTVWGYADSANNVVARWQYDAWGNVLSEVCTVPALATIRYRFQGRELSAVTGLINFRMRWYDPETGRWLSKDPIGLSGGLNLYEFWETRGQTFYRETCSPCGVLTRLSNRLCLPLCTLSTETPLNFELR